MDKDPFMPESTEFVVGEELNVEASALAQFGEHFDQKQEKWVQHNEHGDDCEQLVELKGEPVKVCSTPYVAQAGPNKGQVVHPCLLSEEAGGAMVGIPEGRLKRQAGKTSVLVEMTADRYKEIFGKDPPEHRRSS